ncbi:MAG: chromosome partitioning protein ParB, partial [Lachnospiraceae bacterium]|nr:chromosome partitioning protein ParB [Lachnospiraceae bacterium]
QRYIRLTELQPNILEMVDEGKIAFRPAVEISYLSKPEQSQLYEVMQSELATPSLSQAIKLKDFSKNGRLNEDVIFSIMSEEKPNQREKYVIKAETLKRYIPDNIPYSKTEDYIIKALDFYQRHLNRQRGMER